MLKVNFIIVISILLILLFKCVNRLFSSLRFSFYSKIQLLCISTTYDILFTFLSPVDDYFILSCSCFWDNIFSNKKKWWKFFFSDPYYIVFTIIHAVQSIFSLVMIYLPCTTYHDHILVTFVDDASYYMYINVIFFLAVSPHLFLCKFIVNIFLEYELVFKSKF